MRWHCAELQWSVKSHNAVICAALDQSRAVALNQCHWCVSHQKKQRRCGIGDGGKTRDGDNWSQAPSVPCTLHPLYQTSGAPCTLYQSSGDTPPPPVASSNGSAPEKSQIHRLLLFSHPQMFLFPTLSHFQFFDHLHSWLYDIKRWNSCIPVARGGRNCLSHWTSARHLVSVSE